MGIFWSNNKVKVLGSLATLVAGLLSMLALGLFDGSPTEPALLGSTTTRWMTIVLSLANLLLGGGTVAAGVSNSAKIRVAEAAATVEVAKAATAAAMETAINTPPP